MAIAHLLFITLICVLLSLALMLLLRSRRELEAEADGEAEMIGDYELSGAKPDRYEEYPQAGPRMLAILILMSMQTRSEKVAALAAQLPDQDPFSDAGREKRILLEQLRISRSYQEEAERHFHRRDFTSSDAEWALTAANLSLNFAEKRLLAIQAVSQS